MNRFFQPGIYILNKNHDYNWFYDIKDNILFRVYGYVGFADYEFINDNPITILDYDNNKKGYPVLIKKYYGLLNSIEDKQSYGLVGNQIDSFFNDWKLVEI